MPENTGEKRSNKLISHVIFSFLIQFYIYNVKWARKVAESNKKQKDKKKEKEKQDEMPAKKSQ